MCGAGKQEILTVGTLDDIVQDLAGRVAHIDGQAQMEAGQAVYKSGGEQM